MGSVIHGPTSPPRKALPRATSSSGQLHDKLPALVLSKLVHNVVVRDFDWDERWFHYGEIEYYIFVFALWWCIGSGIDRKLRPVRHAILWSVACFMGVCFSLLLVYGGIITLPAGEYETPAVPISMLLWGLGLSFYFGKEFRLLYMLKVRRA